MPIGPELATPVRMKTLRSSLVIRRALGLATLLSLSGLGCSELKKIDEMKDNTAEMRETTRELNDRIGELGEVAKDDLRGGLNNINTGVGELYDSMRQGDASNLRRLAFERMLTASRLEARVAEAGLYLMSFEFQLLGATAVDQSVERRDLLYHQALVEFFLRLDEIAPRFHEVWPQAQPHPDKNTEENRASAFAALAFALHKINRKQLADPRAGQPQSIYDLLVHALRLKPDIDAGRVQLPAGPHYIKEILAREARVNQLLQTRYNIFTYGLMGLTTDINDRSIWGQIWQLAMKVEIDLSENTRGRAGLQYVIDEILLPAAKVAKDLRELSQRDIRFAPRLTTLTSMIQQRLILRPVVEFVGRDRSHVAGPIGITALESQAARLWNEYQSP